jgi:hypothetical protein
MGAKAAYIFHREGDLDVGSTVYGRDRLRICPVRIELLCSPPASPHSQA